MQAVRFVAKNITEFTWHSIILQHFRSSNDLICVVFSDGVCVLTPVQVPSIIQRTQVEQTFSPCTDTVASEPKPFTVGVAKSSFSFIYDGNIRGYSSVKYFNCVQLDIN
jgi:hypothetical protein